MVGSSSSRHCAAPARRLSRLPVAEPKSPNLGAFSCLLHVRLFSYFELFPSQEAPSATHPQLHAPRSAPCAVELWCHDFRGSGVGARRGVGLCTLVTALASRCRSLPSELQPDRADGLLFKSKQSGVRLKLRRTCLKRQVKCNMHVTRMHEP